MNILVNIKSVSQTRGVESVIYTVRDDIKTVQDLIENLVDIEIDKYEKDDFKALSQGDIDQMVDSGKISFGFKYRKEFEKKLGQQEKKINREEAKDVALLAFSDGLYVVFIGKEKVETLETTLTLQENTEITLVRLTMLAGRYF